MMQNLEVIVGNRMELDGGRDNIHGFLSIGERGREYGAALQSTFGQFAYGSSRGEGSAQIGIVDNIFTTSEYSKGKVHQLSKSFWEGFEKGNVVYVMDDLKATGGTSQGMARHVIRKGGIPVLVTGIKLGYQESKSMEYVVVDNNGEREVYFVTPEKEGNGFTYIDIEDHETGQQRMKPDGEKAVIKRINDIDELGKVIEHDTVQEVSPYVINSVSQTVKHKVKHDGHMHSLYRPV
jgi:hypothetical protein